MYLDGKWSRIKISETFKARSLRSFDLLQSRVQEREVRVLIPAMIPSTQIAVIILSL
jgi:hypothetical protein